MSTSAGKLLFAIGTFFVLHAAYSAFEHLAYLRSVEILATEATVSLPSDIVAEALIAGVVAIVGAVMSTSPLKPIAIEEEMKKTRIDAFDSRPSFHAFGHRGQRLFTAASGSNDSF
ncbi:hypothetical protein GQ42DRAFT_122062 [Ramicandelaber brevisporus]|nr:hypothetical protein GQ42DRAFT_122062 [Ramicandelaber brevisporus]